MRIVRVVANYMGSNVSAMVNLAFGVYMPRRGI